MHRTVHPNPPAPIPASRYPHPARRAGLSLFRRRPLPYVPGHVEDPKRRLARWERTNRACPVGASKTQLVRWLCVSPRVCLPCKPSCRVLPLLFRGQTLAGPAVVLGGLSPIHAVDRVVFAAALPFIHRRRSRARRITGRQGWSGSHASSLGLPRRRPLRCTGCSAACQHRRDHSSHRHITPPGVVAHNHMVSFDTNTLACVVRKFISFFQRPFWTL